MSVDGQTVFDADDVVFDMHDDGAELPVAKPADVAKGPSPAEAKAAMLEVLRGQEAFDAIQDLSGLLDRLFIAANEGRAERPDDDDLMAQVYEGAMGTPPELEVLLS